MDKKLEEIKSGKENHNKDNLIKKNNLIKYLYSLFLFHVLLQERKKWPNWI